MFKRDTIKVQTFTTPKQGIQQWVVTNRKQGVIVAGPFQTREQARERANEIGY